MLASPTRFVAQRITLRSSNTIPTSFIPPFPRGLPQRSVTKASVAAMSTTSVNAVTDAGRGSITHVIFDMDGLLLGNFLVFGLKNLFKVGNFMLFCEHSVVKVNNFVRLLKCLVKDVSLLVLNSPPIVMSVFCRHWEVLHGGTGEDTCEIQQNIWLVFESEDDGEESDRSCHAFRWGMWNQWLSFPWSFHCRERVYVARPLSHKWLNARLQYNETINTKTNFSPVVFIGWTQQEIYIYNFWWHDLFLWYRS